MAMPGRTDGEVSLSVADVHAPSSADVKNLGHSCLMILTTLRSGDKQ